jgi:site-specific DNA recombinase
VSASHANAPPKAVGVTDVGPLADNPIVACSKSRLALVECVHVRAGAIEIELVDDATSSDRDKTIVVPWFKPPTHVQRDVILPANGQCEDPRAMSSDTRTRLLSTIAIVRRWMDDLAAAKIESIDALAAREGRSVRSVTMLLSLAFLAPDLVKAIADNRMPRGVGITSLMDLPNAWAGQWAALGLSA